MKIQNILNKNFIRLFLFIFFVSSFVTSNPVWADSCKYSLTNLNIQLHEQIKSLAHFPRILLDQNGHIPDEAIKKYNKTAINIAAMGIMAPTAPIGKIRYLLYGESATVAKGFSSIEKVREYLYTLRNSKELLKLRGLSGRPIGRGFGTPSVLLESVPSTEKWMISMGQEQLVPTDIVAKEFKILIEFIR